MFDAVRAMSGKKKLDEDGYDEQARSAKELRQPLPGLIPEAVTAALAAMKLPADPVVYNRELQRLLAEHAAEGKG